MINVRTSCAERSGVQIPGRLILTRPALQKGSPTL